MRTKISACLFFFLSFMVFSSTVLFAEPWELTGTNVKKSNNYIIGEPVLLKTNIKNTGVVEDTFMFSEGGLWTIENSKNEIINCNTVITDGDLQTLKAGEASVGYEDITGAYFSSRKMKEFMPADEYKIKFGIRFKTIDGKQMQQYSEKILIKISEPPVSEKGAFKLYKKAMLKNHGKKQEAKNLKLLLDVFKKYPHSIYAPTAYMKWINYNSWQTHDHVLAAMQYVDLIEKYPDFEFAPFKVGSIVNCYKNARKVKDARATLLDLRKKVINYPVIINKIDEQLKIIE